MKSIVSFQLLDNPSVTIKPDIGFIKLYFKNNILTSKNAIGLEKNLVLDTLLTGLSINPVSTPIVATDSIIEAFGKLQGTINVLTSSIPIDISDLTDTTGIIPTNTSDLINDSGFIAIGDVPNTIVANNDVDDTNIAAGKILQVSTDGETHEYVDLPSPTYQTVTIAVADWSGSTTCTKSVIGVTATSWNSWAFAESYRDKIIEFDVRPSGQGAGTITFTADSTPDAEIVFIVQIKQV